MRTLPKYVYKDRINNITYYSIRMKVKGKTQTLKYFKEKELPKAIRLAKLIELKINN